MLTFNLVILLLTDLPLKSQDPELISYGESLLMDGHDPARIEAWCEERQEEGHPYIDLNHATAEELRKSGLFSSYQIDRLILYRRKYGLLFSEYELGSVDGFSSDRVKAILPYIRAGHESIDRDLPHDYHHSNFHGSMQAFTGLTLPRSLAYGSEGRDRTYEGSPWKTGMRMEIQAGASVHGGLAYQKDPGERAFREKLPEHFCGFLAYNGQGILEQCIAGSYRLHFGSGLLIGAGGYHPVMQLTDRPPLRSYSRPYAGNSEWGIHQGFLLGLRPAPLSLKIWTSIQPSDLGLSSCDSPEQVTDWQDFFRESGLHRTANELAGMNLAFGGHSGVNAELKKARHLLGITYLLEYNGLSSRGRDSLGLEKVIYSFHRTSIYGQRKLGNLLLFAEFSPSKGHSTAFLGGLKWRSGPFLELMVQAWYYGFGFRHTYCTSYSRAGRQGNEQGFLLHLSLEPASWVRAKCSMEFYGNTAILPDQLPLSGHRLNLVLENPSKEQIQWRIHLMSQCPDTFRDSVKTRLDFQLSCQLKPDFRWLGALALPNPRIDMPELPWAMFQEISLGTGKPYRIKAQAVLFHLPAGSGHRICFHRPGPYRQFSFPSFSGRGNCLTLYLSLKPWERITVEGNIYRLRYYDRIAVGSGRDQTEGPARLGVNLQLRIRF